MFEWENKTTKNKTTKKQTRKPPFYFFNFFGLLCKRLKGGGPKTEKKKTQKHKKTES